MVYTLHTHTWQASGCTVADDCVTKFDEMKLKRSYKFMIFMIEGNEIKIDQCGPKDVRSGKKP